MENVKKFCTNCGAECATNNKFCPDCGKPLELGTEESNPQTTGMRKKIHPGVKWAIIIFIAVGILGGILSNLVAEEYTCRRCETTTSKIYYDIDGDKAYCEDCAKEYWAPHDYEEYRAKD